MTQIKKILQVEDEAGISDLVHDILEMNGIEHELATTGEEAINALDGQDNYSGIDSYDVFLIDQSFPGGPGSKIAQEIRHRGNDKRIVMFSGADIQSAQSETAHLCNMHYLHKPMSNIVTQLVPALEGKYTNI